MKVRCDWAEQHPLLIDYHDNEWGIPKYDDQELFEMLCLESAQAGLSWLTILKKRENYRKAFDDFDIQKVAQYDTNDIQSLLSNSGIIRNKLKINAFIKNAQCLQVIQQESKSFADYIWSYVDHQPIKNYFEKIEDVPAKSSLSEKISKDLKKRGFKFVGPVICYSFMQSIGMIDDHLMKCFRY
jgi:DNA-3-methyladenine glycosylase I